MPMAPRARRLRYIRLYDRQLDALNAARRENEPAWALRPGDVPPGGTSAGVLNRVVKLVRAKG